MSQHDQQILISEPLSPDEKRALRVTPPPAIPEAVQGWRDEAAAWAAATALLKYVHRFGHGHAEAVSDCLHCNAVFLARWVRDVLGPEPVTPPPPPGPANPPCRHAYADLGRCIDCGKTL